MSGYFHDFDQLKDSRRATRRRKIKRNLTVGLLLALLFVGLFWGAIFLLNALDDSKFSNKDSGISACEKMAENVGQPTKKDDGKPMTNDELQVAIMPFEASKYADIKVAGTNLVTTIYNVENAPQDDESLGGAMALLSTLQTQWGQLQTACVNHGVTLPPLPAV